MFNNAMMKQAKKMQEKMKIAQEEIAKMETEGSSGGIKIKMLGGKTVEDVEISDKLFEQKDILELIGIESLSLNPSRLKCALLSLKVLKVGLYNYLGDSILKTKSSDEFSESKLDEKYSNSS